MTSAAPSPPLDAVVVGSGPNGLAAAVTLARAGRSVLVLEAAPTPGGGCRTAELTSPGVRHDVCAAVHPLAAVSPFFASAGLHRHGLELVHPDVALAHPLDGGRAGALHRSLDDTVAGLGADGPAWRRSVGRVADRWDLLAPALLGPVVRPPRHPLALAGFGAAATLPATWGARAFRTLEAAALFGGVAAHGVLPLRRPLTSAFGLVLAASAHVAGWPVARGGSGEIVRALLGLLASLGVEVRCDAPVRSAHDLPPSRAVLFDLAPGQVESIVGADLPDATRRRYGRFRHGPGVCKVDFELSEPVPWTAEACRRAGTVHLGGTLAEIDQAEHDVAQGRRPERPFVLAAQQSLVDPTRAPDGTHTLWTYCHVPHGDDTDASGRIEAQVERFAPGFRDVVVARHVATPGWYERYDANDVGGDVAGGSNAGLRSVLRPFPTLHPYRTGNPRLFLCSSSTPPGAGVHGMCGFHAARDALATTLA